jgi:hypothetical protein
MCEMLFKFSSTNVATVRDIQVTADTFSGLDFHYSNLLFRRNRKIK